MTHNKNNSRLNREEYIKTDVGVVLLRTSSISTTADLEFKSSGVGILAAGNQPSTPTQLDDKSWEFCFWPAIHRSVELTHIFV